MSKRKRPRIESAFGPMHTPIVVGHKFHSYLRYFTSVPTAGFFVDKALQLAAKMTGWKYLGLYSLYMYVVR